MRAVWSTPSWVIGIPGEKKGKIPKGKLKGKGNGVKQFLEECKKGPSKKPDEVRIRIEKLFPKSKRIELFATQKSKNWDAIGNEIDGKDIRQALKEIQNG